VTRYRDTGETLGDVSAEVLAVCPACSACARITRERGVCPSCAWTRECPRDRALWGVPNDPYLGLPLWLTTPVGDETLWAFNAGHLDLLDAYVSATLRERVADRAGFTLVERLPPWLKSAKNRDAVRAGIARLRERLAEA